MRKWCIAVAVLVVLNFPWSVLEAKMDNLPRLQGATLLLGYPPDNLVLTTENATSELQSGGGDWYVTPSMSSDGHLIASAHNGTSTSGAPGPRPKLTVSTYSTNAHRWTDYKELRVFDGSVAISPDGAKLACLTRKVAGGPAHLRILDLQSGKISAGPELSDNANHLSWSPDGRRIAFDRDLERSEGGKVIPPLRAIYVLDVATGVASKLADGTSPSWSPSGKLIAFYDYSPGRDDVKRGWYATNANRVSSIGPNGTDYKTLATFHRDESLTVPPVWSPDSRTILINRWRDEDKATMDIYLLDLATLKLTKKFANTPPVFAWVAAD